MCSNCRDYEGPYDDNEERTEPPSDEGPIITGEASAPYDLSANEKLASLGLIVLMTLLLVTPKALRWIYFLWR